MECRKYNIQGIVQGVGFRYCVKAFANNLKLSGTVQNLDDGSVQLIVCGDAWQLQELDTWFAQGGPSNCKIRKIDIILIDMTSLPLDFTVV
jgi:acylphosphatase